MHVLHVKPSHLEEVPEQVVALVLAVDKDDDLAALKPLPQHLQQAQEAVRLWPDLHKLLYVGIDHAAAAHLCIGGQRLYNRRRGEGICRSAGCMAMANSLLVWPPTDQAAVHQPLSPREVSAVTHAPLCPEASQPHTQAASAPSLSVPRPAVDAPGSPQGPSAPGAPASPRCAGRWR